MTDDTFRVGYARSFLKPDGSVGFGDIGLGCYDAEPGVAWEFMPAPSGPGEEYAPADLAPYDAVVLLADRLAARSLAGVERLAIVARFGVGYDSVDVAACTAHGTVVTITPDGVRRTMATSILTFLLALAHRLVEKDRLTRGGGWSRKLDYMGMGVAGRTVGSIGVGNIGREFFQIARPLGLCYLAHDPYVQPEQVADLGVTLVDLETLLRESDFVVVNCPLTPETRHLINAERLALMKPTAYLISSARGPIVDEAALYPALRDRKIAGAALDVFEQEPVDPHNPILSLENVIVTPHSICWTDQMFRITGRSCAAAVLNVAAGQPPRYPVDRAVLSSPRFLDRLRRYAAEAAAVGRTPPSFAVE